jgi:ElaB/YqjD/DUF883 family membrane-anchored ribosome-binding protein
MHLSLTCVQPMAWNLPLLLISAVSDGPFDMLQHFLPLLERVRRGLTDLMKGVSMAEIQSATRAPSTQGVQAAPRPDSHETAEQSDHMQETVKEMRDQAQALMTQGKEVAAEYYKEGRNQVLAWQQQLEKQVREKPLQSVLIAAGTGLLYALLRRR